ncbi:DUF1992 domain-containing protein [Aeromicrobium sp. CTD01-1L150]|uniref:DnaJ family domain-containing protein n=1 Tax=Aeromicrobium sp. CTD01-1L150 TaxID=3341830 RepID=UPI0035C0FBB8
MTQDSEEQQARDRRVGQQARWVDLEVQRAIARGDFDDLPGAGRPIEDLGDEHDPDWWLKRLIERERISVLPPALALRTEDARLRDELDALGSAEQVREAVEDFNQRVIEARRQLQGGPPVVTALRDVEAEVSLWRERGEERRRSRQRERDDPTRRRRPRGFLRRTRRAD